MKLSSTREVYLQGLRLLWSSGPVDQALARGQISAVEHGAILESIARKRQVREHVKAHWVVKDAAGHEVAEITRHGDGTYAVRALGDVASEPVVMASEALCDRWVEALPRVTKSTAGIVARA